MHSSKLNVCTKLVLLHGGPTIRASEMPKNTNMRFELDMLFGCLLMMLIILFTINARDKHKMQAQIDELKIIVDQKFLPAMILDTYKMMPRWYDVLFWIFNGMCFFICCIMFGHDLCVLQNCRTGSQRWLWISPPLLILMDWVFDLCSRSLTVKTLSLYLRSWATLAQSGFKSRREYQFYGTKSTHDR